MILKELYRLYQKTYVVSTDTRKITEDCLFFALKGDRFNGNEFAAEALSKGASYAIIDEVEYARDERTILVKDVLETLQALATHHRTELGIPIISLTGSNGKTTTKELINAVLSKAYHTTATQGNLNNHIGVPLTLLSMTRETEIGIVEMGANHLEEIDFLCKLALPDYGYITNFGKAHLEGFGSMAGVVKGKTELYRHLKQHNKTVFINADDKQQLENSKGINSYTFGAERADLNVKLIGVDPYVWLEFDGLVVQTKLIGAYNFSNIAAAIAIGTYFKVGAQAIKEGLESYIPANNRSQIIEKGTNKIILDAYNANPSSMRVALENLSAIKAKYKVAILGDMFELGENVDIEHQEIADFAASQNIDKILLTGANFHKTSTDNERVISFETFEALKLYLSELSLKDSAVLIKASRGMALERILGDL